jgi:hypothetical protein
MKIGHTAGLPVVDGKTEDIRAHHVRREDGARRVRSAQGRRTALRPATQVHQLYVSGSPIGIGAARAIERDQLSGRDRLVWPSVRHRRQVSGGYRDVYLIGRARETAIADGQGNGIDARDIRPKGGCSRSRVR